MIDEKYQGKGCGTAALQTIIRYFQNHGANIIRLSAKETNAKALSLYHKAGFQETGEMNGDEIVLQLNLQRLLCIIVPIQDFRETLFLRCRI